MNLFNSFKLNKKLNSQKPFVNVYSVLHEGKEYTIIVTRKIANKLTRIKFVDNTVYWEQLPLFWRLSGKGYMVKEANLLLFNVSLLQVGKHVMKACGGNASSPFNIISPCKLASEIQTAQVSFG